MKKDAIVIMLTIMLIFVIILTGVYVRYIWQLSHSATIEEETIYRTYYIEAYNYIENEDKKAFFFTGNNLILPINPIYDNTKIYILEMNDNGTPELVTDDFISDIFIFENPYNLMEN